MGRCTYEKLQALEPVLKAIRQLNQIREPKPGIFYLKANGFLHFHEKEEKIWADVRNGKLWGKEIVVPKKITKKFLEMFTVEIFKRYKKTIGDL
jgi:hypothetical protein